jgi:hypothetical protein
MFHHQENNIKTDIKRFQNYKRQWGIKIAKNGGTKSVSISGNACYRSVKNLSSSRVFSKHLWIKVYGILSVSFTSVKCDLSH